MAISRFPFCTAFAAFALLLAGCGEPTPEPVPEDAEDTATTESLPTREVVPVEAAEFESFELSLADLTTYEKGVAFENHQIRNAQKTRGEDGIAALVASLPEQTEPAAAAAAGIDIDRYRNIKQAVGDVLGALDMASVVTQSTEAADTSEMTAEEAAAFESSVADMQAEFDDPYAGVDAAVAEAMRARVESLKQLRADNIGLLMNAGG